MENTNTSTTILNSDATNPKEDTGTAEKQKQPYVDWYKVLRSIVDIENDIKALKNRCETSEGKIETFAEERKTFYENGAVFFKTFTIITILLFLLVAYICITNLWDGIPVCIKESPLAKTVYVLGLLIWILSTTLIQLKDIWPLIMQFFKTGKDVTK